MAGKAESFFKNEATDLLDNKGSGLGKNRNEATVGARKGVEGRMLKVKESRPKTLFLALRL